MNLRVASTVVLLSLVIGMSAEGAKFRYTINEAVETPVWTESDSFAACMSGLIVNGNPISGAGHMVIEVLDDVSVDDSDIGFNLQDKYWWWSGGQNLGVDITIRSGGETRHTFTYSGTKGIKTWAKTAYVFSNIVMTASNMASSGTFYDDTADGGRGTALMNGAEFANCSCRAVRLSAPVPFKLYPGSAIRGNTSKNNGGGVLIEGDRSELVLLGGVITGNAAKLGGGVYLSAAGKVVYSGGASSISGNTSSSDSACADVYAAAAALPFFRVDAVASETVFEYNSDAEPTDGIVYGAYTVEDLNLNSHFVCKSDLKGASIVTESGLIKVKSDEKAKVRYSLDGGFSWMPATSLRSAMESATKDGTTIIELMDDVEYSSNQLFQNHCFTLRSCPEGVRHKVTLKNGAFFWLNKTDVVLSNVLVTAESGFTNVDGAIFAFQGDPASLTMLDGAEIVDVPVAAVGERAGMSNGARFVLEKGAKIVRCGSGAVNAGGFFTRSERIVFELRGGEISSCVGTFGGIYLVDGAKVQVFSDSVVTGNVDVASTASNVYQCRPGGVVIASDAVTGENAVYVAVPFGNDGELVATLADGLEAYEVPAAVLKSDENENATVVRSEDGLCWSTSRAHKDFRYSYDGLLFYEADTFKEAYVSKQINKTPLIVELMRDALILNDDSDLIDERNKHLFFNRLMILRSHGTTRRTLTRKGGDNVIRLWGGADGTVISNIVITADTVDYGGACLVRIGSGRHSLGVDGEIRIPEGLQGVALGDSGTTAHFILQGGSKITGGNLGANGVAIVANSPDAHVLLDVQGEISGNIGNSAVYIESADAKVLVSGGARIMNNFTAGGKPSNLKFKDACGLLVQSGELTEKADVHLSRNDMVGGVFGVSSNVTDSCYQAWAGAEFIHSDVKRAYYGTSEVTEDIVNLVWKKDDTGLILFVR